jgi:hypothetical protein
MRSLALSAAALAILAGCTPMQWENPRLGMANFEQDADQCSEVAWRESWRRGYYDPFWSRQRFVRTRSGRLVALYDPFDDWRWDHQRFMDESFLRNFCMKSKGYQLVPKPDPAG